MRPQADEPSPERPTYFICVAQKKMYANIFFIVENIHVEVSKFQQFSKWKDNCTGCDFIKKVNPLKPAICMQQPIKEII